MSYKFELGEQVRWKFGKDTGVVMDRWMVTGSPCYSVHWRSGDVTSPFAECELIGVSPLEQLAREAE